VENCNTVHHGSFLTNNLPDKSQQLIIADPPYYKVKGEFDFIWKTFGDYLKDVEIWAKECKRLLADNGSLLWYGDNEKIAYTQIILDKYFKLINNLRWKKRSEGLYGSSGSQQIRSFPPCSESILFYSNEWDISSGALIVNKATIKSRDYIRSEILRAKGKIVLKDINIMLRAASNGGGVASSVLSDKKEENTFITEEHYLKLREWLNGDYLRREYEDLRRPFKNLGTLDVVDICNEQTQNKKYTHETCKPEKLTETLILTTSRKGDNIFIPFAGSGTECAMSAKTGRNFEGWDIEKKYVDMSNDRAKIHMEQLRLF